MATSEQSKEHDACKGLSCENEAYEENLLASDNIMIKAL
jgi:hypothetical protein